MRTRKDGAAQECDGSNRNAVNAMKWERAASQTWTLYGAVGGVERLRHGAFLDRRDGWKLEQSCQQGLERRNLLSETQVSFAEIEIQTRWITAVISIPVFA